MENHPQPQQQAKADTPPLVHCKWVRLWMLALIACVIAVLTLALIPAPPPDLTTGWDKSNHLLAFGTLTWLALHAFPQRLKSVLLGLLAYGALIEILQSFTPTRSAEWLDLCADAMGILLGWGLVKLWQRLL